MNGNGYDRSMDLNECDSKIDDSHDVPSDIDSQVIFDLIFDEKFKLSSLTLSVSQNH